MAFTSSRYGYEVAYPAGWTAQGATTSYDRAIGILPERTSLDYFLGEHLLLYAYSAPLPAGKDVNDWILEMQQGCSFRLDEPRPVSVDGHPGRVFVRSPGCSDATAFVPIGDRLFVFVATYPSPISEESKAAAPSTEVELLDAFLSTVSF